MNSVTGEPIRRALVTLSGVAMRTSFSDDEGRFSFEDVPASYLSLQARKPSFTAPPQTKMLDATKSPLDVQLKLMPAGVIFGQIVGPGGEPLEYVPVRVLKSELSEGRRRWAEVSEKQSDEDGNFRLVDLAPGIYKVAAGPSQSRDLASLRSGYAVTYYPSASDFASAASVTVSPAQRVEANFKLQSVPLVRLSGAVLGGSQQGAVRLLDSSDSPIPIGIRYDQSGKFEARVPAGRYIVAAESYEPPPPGQATVWNQGRMLFAKTSINVAKDLTGVMLTLQPSVTIPVLIRKEDVKAEGEQQAGAYIIRGSVRGGADYVSANVQLVSQSNPNLRFANHDVGPPEARSIEVSNVLPGDYDVEIGPSGGWYVASAQCGSKDLLRESLTVAANGQVDPIEIVLRNDGAQVGGKVRGATKTGILLVTSDTEPKRIIRGNFGPDQSIFVPLLPPGTYTLYAFNNEEQVEFTNPEALQRYRAKAAHVTVSPSQYATVTIDLIGVEE